MIDIPSPADMRKMTFLTCDPGKHDCAYALFSGGVLKQAMFSPPAQFARGDYMSMSNVDMAFIELPQVYAAAAQKGDQNDLIAVAFSAGKVVMALGYKSIPCLTLAPREWKGSILADIMLERISDRLEPSEREAVAQAKDVFRIPGGKMHNVLDAVGIGLHLVNRLNRKA